MGPPLPFVASTGGTGGTAGFVLILVEQARAGRRSELLPSTPGSNPGSVDSEENVNSCAVILPALEPNERREDQSLEVPARFQWTSGRWIAIRTGMATSANEGFDIRRRERRQALSGN